MKDLMKKPLFSKILMATSLAVILSATIGNYQLNSQIHKVGQAASGLGICFQRVTQTFTSLMIQSFNSEYLTDDFRANSADCMDQVSSLSEAIGMSASMKIMNNLKSDLHWFDQKVTKVSSLAQKGEIEILQSNITEKYSELENLKNSFTDSLSAKSEELMQYRTMGMTSIVLGMIAMMISFLSSILIGKAKTREVIAIEKTAELAEENSILDVPSLLTRLFQAIETPVLEKQVLTHIEKLESEKIELEDKIIKMNSIEDIRYEIEIPDELIEETEKEKTNFQLSLTAALDRIQQKAFHNGVIIDTDLKDEFEVVANQEALDQLMYYSLSFAMDSTLHYESQRKIVIRSNPLGGIAYLKIKVAGHSFSESDIAILNGQTPSSDTNVNLLLLRELISDANASIAVKNIHNSSINKLESEIEIVFERAKFSASTVQDNQSDTRDVKVVKGKKSDIQAYFRNQIDM